MVMDSRHRKPLQRALMSVSGANIIRVQVNEWAQIQSHDPNATLQYNDSGLIGIGRVQVNGVVTSQWKLVMKFESRIPGTIATPAYWGMGFTGDFPVFTIQKAGASGLVIGSFSVQAITADFTANAVTWNNLPAVSGATTFATITESNRTTAIGNSVAGGLRGIITPHQDPNATTGFYDDIQEAYGMVLSAEDFTCPVNSWTASLAIAVSDDYAFFEYGE